LASKRLMKDMTVGKPLGLILSFAIPLIGGNLFQQFYSMVDTIIVGKTLGVGALAAVGSAGSMHFLVFGFVLGTCAGMAIPISQCFGAKDEVSLRKYLANAIWIAIVLTVTVTTAVCLLTRNILVWMQTPEDIFEDAYDYMFVMMLGIPATVLYNFSASVMRALGDSKRPLYFLIFSSFLNVGLDLIFILVFRWGCAGAAWATVFAQAISGFLCLGFIIKNFTILRFQKGEMAVSGEHIRKLLGMGLPFGLQTSITAVGNVVLQSAVNSLGSVAVASMTAAGKVNMLLSCAYDAMGNAMATYAGQNLGARKLSRVKKGIKLSLITMISYSVVAFCILMVAGQYIALLFVDASETAILANVKTFLIINAGSCFMLASLIIHRYVIQGLGFSHYALFAGIFEMVARAAVAFLLVPVWGFTGACFASPAAWVAANAFLIPCYLYVMKKLKNTIEVVPDED